MQPAAPSTLSPAHPECPSILILTKDEEDNIVDCLRCFEFSDDVVVLDSFSSDRTVDLALQFPNVRVVMSTFDKLFLSVPALAGAVPILLNLASTVTVLFLVIGFYLGISAAVELKRWTLLQTGRSATGER